MLKVNEQVATNTKTACIDIVTRRKRAARWSVISNSSLIVSKLAVGLTIGSISVISEAIHSSVDLIAAIIALIAIRIAARPADKSHPFGHGKIENLSGAIESLLIFAGAGVIIVEALDKFGEAPVIDQPLLGAAIMGASALVNYLVSSYLKKVAKETDSIALLADAAHLHADVVTCVGVLVGLSLVSLTGWNWLDPVVALLVALLIIKAGWDILLHSISGLLDSSLPEEENRVISQRIEHYKEWYVNYHMLRTRQSGPERHIDFHLVVPDEMTALEAHRLCNWLETDIHNSVNGVTVQIHVEPQSICTESEGIYLCSSTA
ncbi:cation diffusion facilitator family transporter [Candidatus Chlorohelix sp.]|uniref:cation diffusion facilitator family transporter n=1 Tax=Candidatus Chlorohelix sp. TaxID=3139201 RepID=UPI003027414F